MFVGKTDDGKPKNIYVFGKYKLPNEELKTKVTAFLAQKNKDYFKTIGFMTSKIALAMKSDSPTVRMEGFLNAFRSNELSRVKS